MIQLSIDEKKKGKFELGTLYLTRGVFDACEKDAAFYEFVKNSVRRHVSGDWGDMSEEDKGENEFSLDKHLRIFSAYNHQQPGKKIWVITEADRSTTTVLFPDEY